MKYVFDVRGKPDKYAQFAYYPGAIAALAIPDELPQDLSFLVWGVTIRDALEHPGLAELLQDSVRASLPTPLYLSGWGVITFHGITHGSVVVRPFSPRIVPGQWELLNDQNGQPVEFVREWSKSSDTNSRQFDFEFQLEQPRGWMELVLHVSGPIHLAINPQDCVTFQQGSNQLGEHGFDWTRTRQLRGRESIRCCDLG